MIYALDTNIVSYILRGNNDVILRWRQEESRRNASIIPLIVYYEIKRGLEANNSKSRLKYFESLCDKLGVDLLTIPDIDVGARIYAARKRQGHSIEDAAVCVRGGYTLVTNNTKHFEGIEGLRLVDWTK